jgi:hypothetical protein
MLRESEMQKRDIALIALAVILLGSMLVSYVPESNVDACVNETNYTEERCREEIAR